MKKGDLIELAKQMIAAPSCCAGLKAAGREWLDAVGTADEKAAAQKLIAEVQADITPIDRLVAFVHSEGAVKYFGAEVQKEIAAHADELKASGAKYCDCGACAPALKFIENKDVLLS